MSSGKYYIDALLSGEQWGSKTVTFSFMTQVPGYYASDAEERTGFTTFTEAQKTAARQALQLWSEVSGLKFVEVSDSGSGGQIRFGAAALKDDESEKSKNDEGAHAYHPGSDEGGDVWIDTDDNSNSNILPGSYEFLTLVHEIGHALGLKHPGNYNAGGGGTPGPYLPSAEDNNQYSVMAYDGHPGSNVKASTPMLYDIAAIQYLYGANNSTRTGNDTYFWDATKAFVQTIWDAGGKDTISAANQTLAATINLNEGSFSSIGPISDNSSTPATNNIAIAYGVTIENAIGGSGNDSIIGNSANNNLSGGAGNDTLNGGSGFDYASYDSSTSAVNVNLATGKANDGFGFTDTLINIEGAIGSQFNDTLTGNASQNTFIGGAGNDTINGGAGFDYVSYSNSTSKVNVNLATGTASDGFGGTDTISNIEGVIGSQFSDTLTGNASANTLNGEAGNDKLIGGAGSDELNGGSGFDYASYENSTSAVNVKLATTVKVFDVELKKYFTEIIDGTASDGFGGTDTLIDIEGVIGSNFNDTLTSYDESNILNGGAGNDTLIGGAGNDTLIGGAGNDNLNGGTDIDYASYTNSTSAVNVNLTTGKASDGFGGTDNLSGIEGVDGSQFNDNLIGGSGNETLNGNDGNDSLVGNGGNDSLVGSVGNDILIGGVGNDILIGGADADIFVFNSLGEGIDTIKDFSQFEGDKIQVSKIGFGANSTNQFNYNTSTGALSFQNTQFATLQSAPLFFNPSFDIVLV